MGTANGRRHAAPVLSKSAISHIQKSILTSKKAAEKHKEGIAGADMFQKRPIVEIRNSP